MGKGDWNSMAKKVAAVRKSRGCGGTVARGEIDAAGEYRRTGSVHRATGNSESKAKREGTGETAARTVAETGTEREGARLKEGGGRTGREEEERRRTGAYQEGGKLSESGGEKQRKPDVVARS